MTLEPPKIIHLDQIESVAGPGTLTWRPVRLTLGVRAVADGTLDGGLTTLT